MPGPIRRPAEPPAEPATGPAAGLVLRPFRAVRYAAGAVDLAAVTSPPYDLIGPDEALRLEEREPHNIVRLVLPDRSAGTGPGRYAHAADLLREWLGSGVLTRDDAAALYVYEERGPDHVQRGLIGAVELRAPDERVVLPHEDVYPGPVADRLAQMRATGAHLEPIYLLVPGTGDAAGVVAEVTAGPPLAEAVTPDGTAHRLWAITDPARTATVTEALRDRQALIADGHHRYAAYRELQAVRRAGGAADADDAAGASPAAGAGDAGLAMLVDAEAYPPTLHAIHRRLAGVTADRVVAALPPGSSVGEPVAGSGVEAARTLLAARRPGEHTYLLAGDGRYRVVTIPAAAAAPRLPADRSTAWRALDVSVLHHAVLRHLPGLVDEQVVFVHDPAAAVRDAAGDGGSAVLLAPASVADVFAVAAALDRMPPKSTSFGPKPRNGIVLRLLDE